MLGSDHRHAGREVYEWITRILRRRGSRKEGFHSGNGSEFINGTVSGLLKKLPIEQTESRPRKSNGNGNGNGDPQTHVVRLHRGSVSELSSPLRATGAHHRFARQAEVRVAALRHATGSVAGTIAGFAAGSKLSEARTQHPDIGPDGPGA